MPICRALVYLSLGGLLSCMNGTGPAEDVSGEWVASRVEFNLTLDLVQEGTSVRGTGASWAFIYPPTRAYTIAGTYSRPSLTLTLSSNDTIPRSLTGTVRDANHLLGVLTFGGFSDTLVFARQ